MPLVRKGTDEKVWNFSNMNKYLLNNIDNYPPSLVHSDYNGLNILVSNKEKGYEVTGIIDWEFAFAGPVYFDIGNMLIYENFDHYFEFEKAFIEGLQSNGIILQNNWKKISKLIDLISLCDLLNHKQVGENRVKDINQLIIYTMKNGDKF